MSLLPNRLRVSSTPEEPRVLDIDGEEAEAAFDALGSDTAREVLATVYDDPKTPPEVREEVGTSLQNVHYHLDNLEEAGLVEPAGFGYSEKGNEMTVYGPASEAVVLFAGEDDDGSRLRTILKQAFGLFLVVGLSTALFAVLHGWLAAGRSDGPSTLEGSDDAAAPEMEVADAAADTAAGLDPVVAFFLGGCVVVALLVLWWALRPRLRSAAPSR